MAKISVYTVTVYRWTCIGMYMYLAYDQINQQAKKFVLLTILPSTCDMSRQEVKNTIYLCDRECVS